MFNLLFRFWEKKVFILVVDKRGYEKKEKLL